MLTITRTCLPEWMDFNGHMRDAYYVLCVSSANDKMHEELGVGPTYQQSTGFSVYNLDTRVRYLKEGREGDPIEVRMRIMDFDARCVGEFKRSQRGLNFGLRPNKMRLSNKSRVQSSNSSFDDTRITAFSESNGFRGRRRPRH